METLSVNVRQHVSNKCLMKIRIYLVGLWIKMSVMMVHSVDDEMMTVIIVPFSSNKINPV